MIYKKGDYTQVPNLGIIKDLSSYDQSVWLWLCVFADKDGISFPSRATLADLCKCDARRVDKSISVLVAKKILKRTKRKKGREQITNLYQLCLV